MVLAGSGASAAARDRFVREAAAIARLEHPHIVPVYAIGEHAGQLYFALKYVAGGPLSARLGGKPWTARKAAELVAVLAGAVGHAHDRGIIHRDIKPGNVLLDEDDRPHITDFGLSRQIEAAGLTLDGAILGTPAYMAPEQAAGLTEAVGPPADVFGLGAILYHLLTGRPPYHGPDVRTTLRQAEQGQVVPVRKVNPQVPTALARICDRALAPALDVRYPTAAAMERDLRRYLTWGRRLSIRSGVVAAALVVLVSVGVALTGLWNEPKTDVRQTPGSFAGSGTSKSDKQPMALKVQAPLKGSLVVRIGAQDPNTKQMIKDWLPIRRDVPGALPAVTGELVKLEVDLNRPAYIYLVWADSKEAVGLYPWDHENGQKLTEPPPPQRPQARLVFPPGQSYGLPLEGEPGLETALLLARTTPLPRDVNLGKLIKPLPRPAYHDPREFAQRGFDQGKKVADVDVNRGVGKKAQQVDEPLMKLLDELAPHFEVVRAVRFAHVERGAIVPARNDK
jgi:hypothetical protein